MRVENPRFVGDQLLCVDCPLHAGFDAPPQFYERLLYICVETKCPRDMGEYQTACLMAEEAVKGGKG